jgi:hypothetical protein
VLPRRCGCDECVTSRQEDSLRHSRSRINAYRALASPSLIALSSKDPILTAFELSWELRRLSFMEHEFKCEYQVSPCQEQCSAYAAPTELAFIPSLWSHSQRLREVLLAGREPHISALDAGVC